MGINTYLQDEDGTVASEILDPAGLLSGMIPSGQAKYPLAQYIDLYGDTIFNRLQMNQLIVDLTLLKDSVTDSERRSMIDQVLVLAKKCAGEPHYYIKFAGD